VRTRLGLKGSHVIELDLFDRQGTAETHITLKAPGGRERVMVPQ
jgi:hypothetical protein